MVEGCAAVCNRHDAEALAALFAQDADFVNVTGLWWNTREKIRRAPFLFVVQRQGPDRGGDEGTPDMP